MLDWLFNSICKLSDTQLTICLAIMILLISALVNYVVALPGSEIASILAAQQAQIVSLIK